MNRKPRHKKKDRLVNQQLAIYSYLHIGTMKPLLAYQIKDHPENSFQSQSETVFPWRQGWDGMGGTERKLSTGAILKSCIEHLSLPLVLSGLMQAVGAFVAYFTVYAQEGFKPSILINIRVEWEDSNVNDLEDSYGQQWVREGGSAFKVLLFPSSHCLAKTDAQISFPWTALMRERRWKFS